jgi:hypothetical protein
MVFPDLDVVTVITGRAEFTANEFADLVFGCVKSDTAIPADTAGAKRLADRISDVSTEKPTSVGTAEKTAASISGKIYRFPPNPLNVKSVSLRLTDLQPSYDAELYTTDTTGPALRMTGPIGLDGCYKKGQARYIQWLGIRAADAVKGAWLNDHTFVMCWLTLGLGPAQLWTFAFDGDSLNLLCALPSGREVSIDGKTGE